MLLFLILQGSDGVSQDLLQYEQVLTTSLCCVVFTFTKSKPNRGRLVQRYWRDGHHSLHEFHLGLLLVKGEQESEGLYLDINWSSHLISLLCLVMYVTSISADIQMNLFHVNGSGEQMKRKGDTHWTPNNGADQSLGNPFLDSQNVT